MRKNTTNCVPSRARMLRLAYCRACAFAHVLLAKIVYVVRRVFVYVYVSVYFVFLIKNKRALCVCVCGCARVPMAIDVDKRALRFGGRAMAFLNIAVECKSARDFCVVFVCGGNAIILCLCVSFFSPKLLVFLDPFCVCANVNTQIGPLSTQRKDNTYIYDMVLGTFYSPVVSLMSKNDVKGLPSDTRPYRISRGLPLSPSSA